MKKKLNLVLREPVKLHQNENPIPTLPSPFEKKSEKSEQVRQLPEIKEVDEISPAVRERKIKKVSDQSLPQKQEKTDYRLKMSPRISQIWGYFCRKAKADGNLKNSFTVTRNEVMREAGIGSTNTYRDALRKFQDLGLIKIELRPGVNAGSVFYLTDLGLDQAVSFAD